MWPWEAWSLKLTVATSVKKEVIGQLIAGRMKLSDPHLFVQAEFVYQS